MESPPSPPPFKVVPRYLASSDSDKLSAGGHFTMSSLAALCASTFAPGLTDNERQAAARAVLRHEAHINGTHYQARTRGGLHPSYIGFNQLMNDDDELEGSLAHKELVKVALQDVFDAVSWLFSSCLFC
jgi:hypothetical protein